MVKAVDPCTIRERRWSVCPSLALRVGASILLWPLDPIILVEGQFDREFVEEAFRYFKPKRPVRVVDLPALDESSGGGGLERMRQYIKDSANAIRSRRSEAPVVVVLDWDASGKQEQFKRLVSASTVYKVLVWPVDRANPKAGRSFKGLERFHCDRVLDLAIDRGAPIAQKSRGAQAGHYVVEPAEYEKSKQVLAAIVREGLQQTDLGPWGIVYQADPKEAARSDSERLKRLAEVDFPSPSCSRHSAREKSIRHGHPSTLHLWWARRPLAACRAMLMALLLPDPCDEHCPEEFKAAARRALLGLPARPGRWDGEVRSDEGLRKVLLEFIGDFANWDNAANAGYLACGRGLVKAAHPDETPLVVDPFAGGGSIPLEALRLGCDAFASDLNPVACLILKVLLEDIPRHGRRLAEDCADSGRIKAAWREMGSFPPPRWRAADRVFVHAPSVRIAGLRG